MTVHPDDQIDPTTGFPPETLNPVMIIPAGQRVIPPAEFAVSDQVQQAASDWPLLLRVEGERQKTDGMLLCQRCRQGIVPLWKEDVKYTYNGEAMRGLIIAHLIQNHGWTREFPARSAQ